MRDNYLETDAYPFATYTGRVARLERDGSGRYRALVRGTLAIHGIERPRDIECTGERIGPELRVGCAFQVNLSDHAIPIPKLMFMKIDEVMELDLDFFLVPVKSGEVR